MWVFCVFSVTDCFWINPFSVPFCFCSEHLPLHDAGPRHPHPGQHENHRRAGLRAGGSERLCQEKQQCEWLRYVFSKEGVCSECLLPEEGDVLQIMLFDGKKRALWRRKGLNLRLSSTEALAKGILVCSVDSMFRVTGWFYFQFMKSIFQEPPFCVVALSRQIKHVSLGHQKGRSTKNILKIIWFQKIHPYSQRGKYRLVGLDLHLFSGLTLCGSLVLLSAFHVVVVGPGCFESYSGPGSHTGRVAPSRPFRQMLLERGQPSRPRSPCV